MPDPLGLAIEGSPLKRVLVVTAHPDDVDFGAGGTVAAWVQAGVAVSYAICTDGDAGGFDADVPRSAIPAIRRAEQTAAAAALGVDDLHWLGFPDGALVADLGLRCQISAVIRRVRPDRVVAQSPERNWQSVYASHPDHLAAGEATLAAVYPDARNPFSNPELLAGGLEAHVVRDVWVMAHPAPDHFVDVTEQLAAKLGALRAHASQETDRDGRLEPMMRGWMGATAEAGGMASGRLAEAFRRLATA